MIYAYKKDNEDELELKEGEIITILSKDLPDKGWWKGELKGKVGVFPDNFVEILSPDGNENFKGFFNFNIIENDQFYIFH